MAAEPSSLTHGNVMDVIRARPMVPVQILVATLCILINVVDGLDVLSMAFTAPLAAQAWSLGPEQTGLLLSAGLAGMGIGALLLSPAADILGRKPCLLFSLLLAAAGMFASAMSSDATQLMLSRLLTGVGIGGTISSVSSTLIEYASVQSRGFLLGLMAVSFPAGAVFGGALALIFINNFGWQQVFLGGAVLTALAIPAVAMFVPESVDFLLARRPHDAHRRINKILDRLQHARLTTLPELRHGGVHNTNGLLRGVFDARLLRTLAYVGATMFLMMLSFYFVLNWAPKILVDRGLSAQSGIGMAMWMNFGGMAGGLATGFAMRFVKLRTALVVVLTAMGAGIACFGLVSTELTKATVVGLVLGFLMYASMVVVYLLMTTVFPPAVRATCIGLSSTLGRAGSVLGPYCGGVLLASGYTVSVTCTVLAVPVCLAGILAIRERWSPVASGAVAV